MKPILCISTQRRIRMRFKPPPLVFYHFGHPPVPIKPTGSNLAVYLTSPLTPATLHDACNSTGVAAHKAECRKHSSNDPKCQELGWVCVPLAVESYGNWGNKAQNTFARLAFILSISLHCPKANVLTEIYGWLNILLVRSVARAILSRRCSIPG